MSTQARVRKILADRYVLKDPLGKGGMGLVWRGEDRLLQRNVAIKEVTLPAELPTSDREAVHARVLREARAAARLTHPSVVTVFDVLQEDGTAYIVMEIVTGRTLAQVVEDDGPLPAERVARVGLEVLGALERAHAEGIVHRDVKPANVMIDVDGRVKLADFGIASLKGDPKLTQTGILLGSPSFMAPEQAQDLESGPAVDLWALGATLYFAVEGQPPFDRGKPISTLTSVVYDDPRPFERAGALAPVITSLLAKDPQSRPAEPEVRRALQAVAGGESRPGAKREPARPTVLQAPPRTRDELWSRRREEPVVDEVDEHDEDEPRSWRGLLVGAAVIVALLAAALLFNLLRGSEEPPGTAAQGRREARGERSSEDGGRASGQASGTEQGSGTGEASGADATEDATEEEEPEAPVVEGSAGVVPVDWVTYTDPNNGFTIAHPPDWQIVPDTSGPNSIDIREPLTGTYLRVAWTDSPGPSPQAAWEKYAPQFGATHDRYREIQITPTTFMGFPASLWEYEWSSGSVDLHAYNLGFVTGEYGFALNFQTRAENWERSQGLWEAFKAGFQPPT